MSLGANYAIAPPVPEALCAACRQALRLSNSATTVDWHTAAEDHPQREAKPRSLPPGILLAGRYRVLAILGKGGMGQVYRADDLTLEQPVALKYFPGPFSSGAALARLYREVRMARRVAHPNICRVFDVLETDGDAIITMEFVDGEDLDTLLRRIGRLAPEKALDVAHQICAGLVAAHEAGVLHRDLKPGNIMLDGRGKVRITDFGLAARQGEPEGGGGTPAYMAPEQIAGRQASVQSDVYALGLLLYEIFNGRRAFEAGTSADQLRTDRRPTLLPCNLARLHPAVRQVIWRCLEPDPAKRPGSAAQVMHALPARWGGSRARCEMPEPACAPGERRDYQPRLAWLLLACTMLGFALLLVLGPRLSLPGMVWRPRGSAASVFVWFWFTALQSFLALLSMAYLLREKAKPPS
jgi:eukaryotic-like serine/threonine-protein kinase